MYDGKSSQSCTAHDWCSLILHQQVFPSSTVETQLTSAVPRSPTTLQDSTSSPPSEKLQTVPTFIQSPVQESGPAVREACVVRQR